MRIGIDCDGVLRDFIGNLISSIKTTHPQHSKKILDPPKSWEWEDWLPFWTDEETEKYVFEDYFIDLFGIDCPPLSDAIEDWPKLKQWAKENDHELVLVSAQRENCKELTTEWLKKYGFDFDEIHYTHNKWAIDVDVLVDDSPAKLKKFKEKNVANGHPICFKTTWNTKCHNSMMTIDRLSDLIGKCFG